MPLHAIAPVMIEHDYTHNGFLFQTLWSPLPIPEEKVTNRPLSGISD